MVTIRPYDLARYKSYDRKEIATVLAPAYTFQPQVGTWGLQGIVPFAAPGDYAFFVTFGQVQGEHHFDEAIYESGIVRWQSQPSQGLDDKRIRDFISHDETANDILLFLRARPRSPYIYMGPLRYVNHDRDREKPVHFNWQLIDFDPSVPALIESGLQILPVTPESKVLTLFLDPVTEARSPRLKLTTIPSGRNAGLALPTHSFSAVQIDYVVRDQQNRALGRKGGACCCRI